MPEQDQPDHQDRPSDHPHLPAARNRAVVVSAAPAGTARAARAEADRLLDQGYSVLFVTPAFGKRKPDPSRGGVHVVEARVGTAFDTAPGALGKLGRKAVLTTRNARGRALRDPAATWTAGDVAAEIGPYLDAFAPDVVVAGDKTAEKAVAKLGRTAVAPGAAKPVAKTVDPAPSLLIGSNNNAGMGYAWARAVDTHAGIRARNIQKKSYAFGYGSDIKAEDKDWVDPLWGLGRVADTLDTVTHVLSESGLAFFGRLNGGLLADDLPELRRAGIRAGLLFHGSDIRSPDRHVELYKFSPFRAPATDADRELTETLRRKTAEMAEWVADFDGPVFVSTPDLIDDVPQATWLPVVVDLGQWTEGARPPLEREVPVVVHAPSRPFMKGSDLIEPTLRDLEARGLIEYRRLEHIPQAELVGVVQDADIVLDHFVIGNYGVMTCQAMAAGRVSIANIDARVRGRVPVEIPTIQADPDTLGEVIEGVLADRDAARAVAATGRAFVQEFHDGRKSAQALEPWLRG
ncbi:hypothetical protein [Catenulispora subtropica]|uniref:Uncharacterized protein n=1 Tax=Catenulispora subtropica TaxID=450798 RepID=A0ABN2RKU6_9ACTN